MQTLTNNLLLIPDPPPPWNMSWDRFDGGRSSGSSKPTKVVIVDDESTIADTLVEILKAEGYDVAAASNGDEAIDLVRTFQPDIVLSDVIIPGINGIEAGVKIREFAPDCRIILFSGQAATVDLVKNARARGHEFEILAKPIKPEALLSVLRRKTR